MKFTLLIILTLVQFSVQGQLGQWTQETITKNKIVTVLVFQKVPKTNPEYYNKPKGFMAISQTKFASSGLVIEDVCKGCAICFHCDQQPTDIVEKYYYDKGRLLKKEISRFEKSSLLFYYDTLEKRIFEIGLDKNNERNSVKIKNLDNDGKEISGYEIDFENVLVREDSAIQIFLTKSSIEYKEQSVTLKEFSYGSGTNIDRITFEIFQNSFDFDVISKTFESLDYKHLQLRRHTTTYYDEVGNELKQVDATDGTKIREYKRDKKGRILTELVYWPKYTEKHEYRYEFRD